MSVNRHGWGCLFLALVLSFACRAPGVGEGAAVEAPEWADLGIERGRAGTSREGRAIEYAAFGNGTEAVMILATIHGNESAGTPICGRLEESLLAGEVSLRSDLRLVLVPVVNPDGLAHRTRSNAAGVDLNRNFPAENFEASKSHGPSPRSEPESAAIARLIDRFDPALLVVFHEPLDCVDYDGPAEAAARRISDASPLPLRKLGGRPGSLGSYAGLELGIPTVTVELPGLAGRLTADELWAEYGELVRECLEPLD